MNTVSVSPVLANLPRSLSELWRTAVSQQRGESITRALTQNLILVTTDDLAAEMHDMIDGLLSRHPCRAIVVVVSEPSTGLAAELLGRIRDRGHSHAMVLEKLTITTDWADYKKLPNLIRPLLVNDIPTSLFWAMALPDSLGKVAALAGMADRTLVDSSLFLGDDWRSLRQLNEFRPIDLAWLRVAPWRRALAEAFEHFEWTPVEPETSVVIEHGPAFGAIGAARCLEHWLVRRLDAVVRLREITQGPAPATPAPPGRPARAVPCTEPCRLTLQHGPVHIRLEHTCTEPRIRVNVTLDDQCLLPTFVMASRGARCHLLAAALDSKLSMGCA